MGHGNASGRSRSLRRKRHSPEQVVAKLREAEVLLSSGQTVGQVVQRLGVSEQTYHRWRAQYGGMRTSGAKRLKALEKENARLKRLVAEQALDIQMLKEVAEGKW